MLNVFIDTNVILRFYSYSDDTLAEVEKVTALVKAGEIKLFVTEQIVDERARNRDKALNESIKRLEQVPLAPQVPRFAEHHAEAKTFREAAEQAAKARKSLVQEVRKEIADGALRADRVIQELFDSSPVLARTPEMIERAMLRQKLSNPPGKSDSLGDQINWEIMLENAEIGSDLHIISRDGDFGGGPTGSAVNFFLRGEWNHKKRAKLFLYAGLGEFAKEHFPNIEVPSDAVKSSAIKKLVVSGSFSQTHDAIAELAPLIDVLDPAEALKLFEALISNSQISSIINDQDVKEFYRDLYVKHFISVPMDMDAILDIISDEVFALPF